MVCPCLAPFVVHTWRDRAHAIYDKCSQMVSPYAWIFGQFCVWFCFAVFYSTSSGNFYTGCSIPFNLFSQLVLSIQKCLLACGQWRMKKTHRYYYTYWCAYGLHKWSQPHRMQIFFSSHLVSLVFLHWVE